MKTRWEHFVEVGPDALVAELFGNHGNFMICHICIHRYRGTCPVVIEEKICRAGMREYLNQEVDHE